MDFEEIKDIIQNDGGKFIIVENGQPVMVVISFEDYKNKLKFKKQASFKEVNSGKETKNEELTIEDLPF